ncbi:NAD(P)/FAD-dependent oxidoreductase [Acidimangrovimonas pyrenivorans]|uniref:NAD(P)/FAD-dependent oxidoreductase n=1 Tax=Acidimangrovimonas pyrenivorans TaxID=2030798 RepID=A0ABV7AGR4_9RHOB
MTPDELAPARVDLVIVGGGFTGCAAALEAARTGATVALLEAETIGHGGSGRNVGLVNAGLWLPPETVIAEMGDAPGRRLLAALSAAPGQVFDLIAREGIACEATRAGTLHLAHSAAGLRDLRERCRQGGALGAPLALLDAAEAARRTGSAAFHGALFDPRAGTVQPLAYARGLARAARAAGARLHERAPVAAIARKDSGWEVTANGTVLRADALLLATNAYHGAAAGMPRPRFTPVHYSQFATAPLPDALRARILPGGEGCWDTATVMSSFRMDRAGRLVLGGIGDVSGPGAWFHTRWARRKLRALFPELPSVPFSHHWQGRIAMTSDHIPKLLDIGPRGFAIFGYSGRGIAPGTALGTAAARALLGAGPEALPLPVRTGHSEHLPALRAAYYECGATLTHALLPLPKP